MKCFYHKTDLDGICSGAIVQFCYPECTTIGIDYDRQNDFTVLNEVEKDEEVFVVDFSFSEEIMTKLAENGWLVWIDHHKSAIERLQPLLKNPEVHFEYAVRIGSAGCELTWEFLSTRPGGSSLMSKPMPTAVKLLGRYDVWDHKDPNVLPFQYGMRNMDSYFPDHPIWADLFTSDDSIGDIVIYGNIVLDYEQRQNAKIAKGMAFECNFHGLRAIAMNKPYSNSKVFESVYDPAKHDIMILFGMKPGSCKYSLYCEKEEIDVSAIAKEYGGGGHRNAAGFFTEQPLILEACA